MQSGEQGLRTPNESLTQMWTVRASVGMPGMRALEEQWLCSQRTRFFVRE